MVRSESHGLEITGGAYPAVHPAPQIPNQDGSGHIDAVGPGVDPARLGQAVWVYLAAAGRRWGTAAEWTVIPAERAVPLPEGVSLELGAMLGVPAITAYHCCHSGGLLEGTNVLVAGGAGAVGHFAIELARFGGARVAATASTPRRLIWLARLERSSS